ncbi:MAG: hypothetical protein GY820_46670 [Gammaproteobacteria bacterium]|nr:hypothetical protein [Gammaproteobacteria bacterium]
MKLRKMRRRGFMAWNWKIFDDMVATHQGYGLAKFHLKILTETRETNQRMATLRMLKKQ